MLYTAANGIAWLLLWGRLLFTQLFRYAAVTASVKLSLVIFPPQAAVVSVVPQQTEIVYSLITPNKQKDELMTNYEEKQVPRKPAPAQKPGGQEPRRPAPAPAPKPPQK